MHLVRQSGVDVETPKASQTGTRYSRNLAHLISGTPGLYEMVAFGTRLRGRLVERVHQRTQHLVIKFLPYELKELKTGKVRYSRSEDTEHIFILVSSLMGYGPLYAPDPERLSGKSLDDIEDVQRVMWAAVFCYAARVMQDE